MHFIFCFLFSVAKHLKIFLHSDFIFQSYSKSNFSKPHNPPLLCVKYQVQQVALESNSYLKTNRLRRKMTSNKRSFLKTPPLFNDSKFNIWQARFRIFIKIINHELWEIIIDGKFIPTRQVNMEVIDTPDSLWTEEEKRKFEINFKTTNFITMTLYYRKFHYVHPYNTAKKSWDTLKMIYGVSPSIKQEKMNTRGEKDEDTNHKCFSKFRNIRNYLGNFITNKYLRISWKFNPILKSKDGSLHEFQKK